jgi:branched-chain amino acid transport system substrate-binding protein
MIRLRNILVGVSVVFFLTNLFAQDQFRYNEDAEKTFSNAVHLTNNKEDAGALRLFQRLIEMQPVHQRTTGSYVMAGKVLQRLGRYTESIRLLKFFIKTYHASIYRHDAEYTLAVDYLMIQQPAEAVTHLAEVADTVSGRALQREVLALIKFIPSSRIDDSTLHAVRSKARNPDVRDLLALKVAENDIHSGQIKYAGSLLDEILYRVPKSSCEQDALTLKGKLSTVMNVKVGVILPLMKNSERSQIKSIAEEILDGINYALRQVRQSSSWNGSITLDIRDSEKEPKVARNELKDLASDKNIIGVIGPLFSQEAQFAAPVAAAEGVPLLTPTATANGIAAAGASVFQVNPDFENRGKAMAIFAVKDLGYTKLGVLASSEPTGKALAESFTKEARRLGATIVASEYYPKGASDLSDQFYALRNAGGRLDGKSNPSRNLDIPVHGIQGLFIPISDAEEIGIIASQMKYFNINTTMLGNDEWYNLTQLDLSKRYLGHLYVLSDTYIDDRDPLYIDFTRLYIADMKKAPTKYSAIGYDVMNLVSSILQAGADSRDKLSGGLARVHGYRGVHSMITLDHRRVNSELYILQYQDGKFQLVKDISIK